MFCRGCADNGLVYRWRIASQPPVARCVDVSPLRIGQLRRPESHPEAEVATDLILGSQGQASIFTFADDVALAQDMTPRGADLDKAFRALHASGDKSVCLDAVLKAAELLRNAPANSRRILLLIAQCRPSANAAISMPPSLPSANNCTPDIC